jgi:hypothetical protein
MATVQDADLILKLYDLRREGVCRQARAFFAGWNPTNAEDVKKACSDMKWTENAYVRQSTSYWEMAFSIANEGAVNETLFAKNCGEGLIFAIKCQWLKAKFPDVWTRTMPEAEAFIAKNEIAKKKAEMFRSRFVW